MSNNRQGVNSFDPPVGLLRTGTIVGYDPATNVTQVQLTEAPAVKGKPLAVPVPTYFPYADSNGLFIGSLPAKGTPVTIAQATGGQYFIVNHNIQNTNILPTLNLGEMLFQTTNTSFITLDMDSNIYMGSNINNIHTFAGSQQYPKSNYVTINFENENHFNQAYREVGGLVKRDLRPNPQAASFTGSTKLEDDTYDNLYFIIGMDPTATSNDLPIGATKNPPFVEHRELVYEFQYQSSIDDDVSESNKYSSTTQQSTIYTTQNRRSSRADTMSLSLVSPNFLMEEVKGTVIDIFGNILDLNRGAVPVGLSADTTFRTNGTTATTNAQQSFTNIRALERKSIAYHFEINARKNPALTYPGVDLSINADNYNAKLQRSRFSFDVDKEGQFKLNVPASSEFGNVPLLVRAENYSTFATTDSGNPNQTWFTQSPNNTGQDIYVDSFAAPMTTPSASSSGFSTTFQHGSVILKDGSTGANQGPIDRISQFVGNSPYNIRHGTAYHDILQTCSLQQNNQSIQGYPLGTTPNPINTNYIQNLTKLVSTTIITSGSGANAGGRSGSINMDGSLDINIGANTVDKQSIWLDTAGGMVANIGRDLNSRSALVNFDGDVFIQVGGYGVAVSDARFPNSNGARVGTLDLRVFAGGYAHMFRIDSTGVTLMTPQSMNIYSAQGINMQSDGPIYIDSDNLYLNQRLVLLGPAVTI
jgi:hypothetical protein